MMVFRKLLPVFLAFFATLGAAAQETAGPKNPIDRALDECLAKQRATMPRAECYSTALGAWEKETADNYAALLEILPAPVGKALRASQAAWEKYRDAEFEYISKIYADRRGSGYIAVRIIERTRIVRDRAVELKQRLVAARSAETEK
ncbi:MAG: DUF1311 domain-containing protein [Acidobacteria bacterium]|nr:DUF1311 domain-containing protein [Acidobacteriota bacterium]